MSKYGVISSPNAEKYGPDITPCLDNFHAVVSALMPKITAYRKKNIELHLQAQRDLLPLLFAFNH